MIPALRRLGLGSITSRKPGPFSKFLIKALSKARWHRAEELAYMNAKWVSSTEKTVLERAASED